MISKQQENLYRNPTIGRQNAEKELFLLDPTQQDVKAHTSIPKIEICKTILAETYVAEIVKTADLLFCSRWFSESKTDAFWFRRSYARVFTGWIRECPAWISLISSNTTGK